MAVGETSIHAVERLIEAVYQILMQMLTWLVELVPLAVLCAVAMVVGKWGLSVFHVLWVFLAVMLLGLGLHSLVYYPLAAWLVGRKSPRVYLGEGADAIVTGLSTNSSLATIPVTLRCLTERMGVSHQSARLSACVGTNFNNDGITLYEAMAALFLAQAVGLDLNVWQQVVVVLASLMAGDGDHRHSRGGPDRAAAGALGGGPIGGDDRRRHPADSAGGLDHRALPLGRERDERHAGGDPARSRLRRGRLTSYVAFSPRILACAASSSAIQASSSSQSTGGSREQVGPQARRALDVDVLDLLLRLVGVPVQQDADAAAQRAGHVQLVRTQERHVQPAELPRGQGREFGVQIGRRA